MMTQPLHCVLGASGATGKTVIEELQKQNLPVRAVGRSHGLDNTNIEYVKADALDAEEIKNAIQGASHVYLCLGLPYSTQVWQRDWPRLMQHVIDACIAHQARLIFLDNIYMYGPSPLSVPFDENHPQNPVSKKGKARKQTTDLLLQTMQEGKLNAVVGRSADFYGKYADNSIFYPAFLERMLKDKAPQSVIKPGIKHSYATTTDNARALVSLALDHTTYGEVWHLPVGKPITIEEIMAIFNQILGTQFKITFLSPWMQKLLVLFIKPLKEVGEMLYQFNHEYVMSWDKFHQHFPDFQVTSYTQGIEEMVTCFKSSKTL